MQVSRLHLTCCPHPWASLWPPHHQAAWPAGQPLKTETDPPLCQQPGLGGPDVVFILESHPPTPGLLVSIFCFSHPLLLFLGLHIYFPVYLHALMRIHFQDHASPFCPPGSGDHLCPSVSSLGWQRVLGIPSLLRL